MLGITSNMVLFTTVSWEDSHHLFSTEMNESWHIGSKQGSAQEFKNVPQGQFLFHSNRSCSRDFSRNFEFVLAPNPAFQGIKNLMNFFTWWIHPIFFTMDSSQWKSVFNLFVHTDSMERFIIVKKYSISTLFFKLSVSENNL